jgi:hypothetical protein
METEQLLSPPEGHDHSEIESDHEFDTMSRSDWFGEESSSSEDEADPMHDSTEDQLSVPFQHLSKTLLLRYLAV